MILKEKYISIFLLVVTIFTFSEYIYSQDDVIRIETDLVKVPITVTDRQGRYVTDLQKENFQVFEDGSEQEVSYFENIEQPFTVFLLLDTSGSMTNYKSEMVAAVNAFVNNLRPNDQIIAVEYAHLIKKVFNLTKVKDLKKGFKLQKRWGQEKSTITFDAVEYALKKMKKIQGRKGIVMFSDGEPYGVWASSTDNLEDAEEQEAIIYTILFNDFVPLSQNVSKEVYADYFGRIVYYMQTLAQTTGGRYFHIKDIANLEDTFSQVAKELGQQYSIGYYPKTSGKKGERRQIKVKVNVPNVAVRARDSYIVGANKN